MLKWSEFLVLQDCGCTLPQFNSAMKRGLVNEPIEVKLRVALNYKLEKDFAPFQVYYQSLRIESVEKTRIKTIDENTDLRVFHEKLPITGTIIKFRDLEKFYKELIL